VRVQYKLFAITLFASFVLVASMLALAQWSFDRGLLEHVNKRALQQYTSLSKQLVSHYQDKGHWQALSESRYAWLQLQADAGIDIDSRELQRARQDSVRKSSGHQGPRPERRHQPFDRQGPEAQREHWRANEHRPPREDRLPPPGKNPKPERFALLDEDKQLLAGDLVKPEHRQYLEIIQAGQIIGYVVYADRERLLDDYELDLSSQLSSNLWWVAGLMILLSASLALPFSKLLLSPLRPIVESIHALAKGDFSRRVEVVNQDEIGRVAKDINHLAQQLETVDTSRKTWLANISHELRTPLAVMRGELEAMLDGIREMNKDNLSSAHQEALHLQRLVEDLYQLTSSELGDDNVAQMSYQKQELDFSALVEDDLERFQPLIDKAGLNFSFINNAQADNKEAWVRGDSSRLSQLIHNLVNNSIKYTQAPGTLMAELTVKNDVIVFTLKDSAPSVKEGELEKIFDHLYRAEQSRNRKTGGSGLGLAICKKIAQSHEGELTASLSDLGGIKMTLCLPLS
jgi:two-component system sensor histidine kinase BaeS